MAIAGTPPPGAPLRGPVGVVVVDLSNVARDRSLGESSHLADLGRWYRLRAAFRDGVDSSADFQLIADATLRRDLSRVDQTEFDRLAQAGVVTVVPDADVEVLARAIDHAGAALSNDRFVDHRRIEGLARAHLMGWVARGPSIRIVARPLERLLSAVISQRALQQELKDAGLTEDSPELRNRWTCVDPACLRDLVAIPQMKAGSARCPECDSYLDRGAPWRRPVWLKVLDPTGDLARFVLEEDDEFPLAELLAARGVGSREGGNTSITALIPEGLFVRNRMGIVYIYLVPGGLEVRLRYPASGERNRHSPPVPAPVDQWVALTTGLKVIFGPSGTSLQLAGSKGFG